MCNEEDWRKAYEQQERKHRRGVWREKDADQGDYFVSGYICGEEVSEGGWYQSGGKIANWMTKAELFAFQKRCQQRSDDSAPKKGQWIPHQCGGCKWFAALNSDWGFCCAEHSPNDGRVVFEHGGCPVHSYYGGLTPPLLAP